jgi:methyl-accepting chemotaxis protein
MAEEQGKFLRKNYFVRKGFQLRFSIVVFVVTLVICVIAVWTTYITTWQEISAQVENQEFFSKIDNVYQKDPAGDNAAMVNSIIVVEFAQIFDRVSGSLILRMLIGAFVLFVLSIFVSHKIAGPLFRMENAAKALERGDLSVNISNLRPGDELEDLARAIDAAITKLRGLMERYRQMAVKLTDLASKINSYQEGGQNATVESTQLIKELEVVSSQLVTEMNYFKTKKQEIQETQEVLMRGKITHY